MHDYHVLDVFTQSSLTGNPLAVVLAADDLDDIRMLAIAREFNLSETVFVLAPTRPEACIRARIFTPGGELPFAGHPTIGLACLWSMLGRITGDDVSFVIEEAVGLVPVRVSTSGSDRFAQLSAAQPLQYGPPLPAIASLAQMLGLDPAAIVQHGPGPRSASGGVPYALVPLRSTHDLAAVSIDTALWRDLFGTAWAREILLYAPSATADLRLRMFAPGLGIAEDPATGSAAVALAGALASEHPQRDGTLTWTLEQGIEMDRPSRLFVEADKRAGEVVAVRVGGHAVHVMSGRLLL